VVLHWIRVDSAEIEAGTGWMKKIRTYKEIMLKIMIWSQFFK